MIPIDIVKALTFYNQNFRKCYTEKSYFVKNTKT